MPASTKAAGDSGKAEAGPVGRPRSTRARKAILEATNTLLEEQGFAGLCIEAIAARAGVGKSTIYRWWAGKGPLAMEAFLTATEPRIAFPNSASPLADLKVQIHLVAKAYRGQTGRILREILAIGQSDDKTLALYAEGYLNPRREDAKRVLALAVEKGELRKGLDLDTVVDALYGPIFHRMMSRHLAFDDSFVDQVVAMVLDGIRAR